MMGLIDKRASSVMKKVKLVVQVVGHSKVPMVPKYSDELRNWYGQQNVSHTQAQVVCMLDKNDVAFVGVCSSEPQTARGNGK